MAKALYLVTKSGAGQPEKTNIDDIHACLINSDDGGSDADIIAEAIAQAVVAGHPLPAGYFDTVEDVGDLTTGKMPTDEDTIVILRRGTTEIIA